MPDWQQEWRAAPMPRPKMAALSRVTGSHIRNVGADLLRMNCQGPPICKDKNEPRGTILGRPCATLWEGKYEPDFSIVLNGGVERKKGVVGQASLGPISLSSSAFVEENFALRSLRLP